LGLTPKWVDGTAVGGCSFMIHVRHAAAAIESGLCKTVLITHGESGRSGVGRTRNVVAPTSLAGQFEQPYGPMGPPTLFTIPVLRYMKTYGLTDETLAMVSVVQREWAAKNPRATFRTPITVEDVLNSRMIAYPFRLLQCCLVTDGGGALILVAAERAKDFPQKPVYLIGTGESVETPMVSQMQDFTSSRAFRVAGPKAFAEAGITHKDVDHLMIYDAFAHLPIYGLEDLGFVGRGEAGAYIAERNTAPGGRLPLNTNGGGLSYMHSGMYGMYALQESVRQMRGIAQAQVPRAEISVCHGVGGMFAASGTIIMANQPLLADKTGTPASPLPAIAPRRLKQPGALTRKPRLQKNYIAGMVTRSRCHTVFGPMVWPLLSTAKQLMTTSLMLSTVTRTS
jgi:acetyl-CoA acetyltransferase